MKKRAPSHLKISGRNLWNKTLRDAHWLRESDLYALQTLCELDDEKCELRALLEEDPSDWRSRRQLRAIDETQVKLIRDLKLVPATKTRDTLGDGAENRLHKFRREWGKDSA